MFWWTWTSPPPLATWPRWRNSSANASDWAKFAIWEPGNWWSQEGNLYSRNQWYAGNIKEILLGKSWNICAIFGGKSWYGQKLLNRNHTNFFTFNNYTNTIPIYVVWFYLFFTEDMSTQNESLGLNPNLEWFFSDSPFWHGMFGKARHDIDEDYHCSRKALEPVNHP